MSTIYIAGPMRGYDDYNFPAFFKAEEECKAKGWTVINPARIDTETGIEFTESILHDIIKRDLECIMRCDAIYMLEGWEVSHGATAEHAVARWAKHTLCYQGKELDEGVWCVGIQ